MDKTTAAILVDYDFYMNSNEVRKFVKEREGLASLVCLVSSPEAQDPDNDKSEVEWDVVIRNIKGHPDMTFKLSALNALAAYSNVYPALAIDLFNKDLYNEAGVLLTLDGVYFEHYDEYN